MKTEVFLEVILCSNDMASSGFEGRDEIEDPLTEALSASSLGEVTGGGGGLGITNIDIEIIDEAHLQDALVLIRKVLQELNVPRSTLIKRHVPIETTFRVYDT